jgi:hypothetical protein
MIAFNVIFWGTKTFWNEFSRDRES